MTRTTLSLDLKNEAETIRLGEDLALALTRGDMVRLSGDLGAGKTCLARAIIRAACNDDAMEVPSPTFTLVQIYKTDGPCGEISHFDLYRLEAEEEIEELGLFDALDHGVVLVEWPEKAEGFLPDDGLTITLEHNGETGRKAVLCGNETIMARIERSFQIRGFLDRSWHKKTRRRFLLGDASTRTYETSTVGETCRILMNSPPMSDGPVIMNGKPYSQIAHLAEDVRPFFAIARILGEKGFTVPNIHAGDFEHGFLLIDDLGNEGIITGKRTPDPDKYIASVETLAHLHQHQWSRKVDLEDGTFHTIPLYDRTAMMIEVDLLTSWYVPRMTGNELSQDDVSAFKNIWHGLIDRLADCEKSLVLRDFHSPNILWQAHASGIERVGMIDFQDAMIGPAAYDVASLAQDARIAIPEELEQKLLEAYLARRKHFDMTFDAEAFLASYAIMAAQRATKVMGIFVRLDERDGKPGYLAHLPHMQAYLKRSLRHPVLSDLKDWLNKIIT